MKSLLKELELARARVAELEHKAEQERRELLASLPEKYGFASFDEFADAVRVATGLKQARSPEISPELEAGKAATPYWREAPESETVSTTFVAQGIQASRSAQASSRSGLEDAGAAAGSGSNGVTAAAPGAMQETGSAQPTSESSATASTSLAALGTPSAPTPAGAPVAASVSTPAPAPRPIPTGTSLSDPSNFGLLPDESLLERGDKSEDNFRMQLNTANIFAQQVLHTSRVPAAVWRAWRDFARRAADVLRGGVPVV